MPLFCFLLSFRGAINVHLLNELWASHLGPDHKGGGPLLGSTPPPGADPQPGPEGYDGKKRCPKFSKGTGVPTQSGSFPHKSKG